jgi:DNA gyrase/topoisomerase IV subunit B
VTDIIDNSFDARTEAQLTGKEPLRVDVIIDPQQGGSVRIVDNARGMSDRQAQDAFTLGRTDKKRKRVFGFHGMGLKVSSGAIGGAVEVTTQPERGYEKYVVHYDPSELKGWNIKLRTLAAIPGLHGTEVCIPKRKMFVARWTIEKLTHEIGTCYFDELQAGRAVINIHYGKETIKCQPIDHKWAEDGKWEGS